MNQDFVIEEVRDLDAAWPELTTLFSELHDYHVPIWPREFRTDWQERWREYVRLNDDRLILIAKELGAPVGYVNAAVIRDYGLFDEAYGQLGEAYVREEARSRGIGSAMLAQAEAWCRAKGVDELRVGVVAANQIGIRFWTKSGFAVLTHTMTKSLKVRPT